MSEIVRDKTIYNTAPTDARQDEERACYELLDSLGVSYSRLDYEAACTMEDCQEIGELLRVRICKNLFLCNRQKTSFYLLLMPGDKPFRTKDLSSRIGSSRLSFAEEEHMRELLRVTPGSVSVLALMNDKERLVRLLIDKEVLEAERFGCHPCKNTSSISFSTSDLLEKVIPALRHEYTEVEL